jgi:transcriptional regulator with XRE-family HTH domain
VVESRVEPGREVRRRRGAAGLTRGELAERIGSSRSRVARAEGTADGMSLDLLVRAVFATEGEAATLGAVPSRSGGWTAAIEGAGDPHGPLDRNDRS